MNARGRINDVIGLAIVLGLATSLLLPMTAIGAELPGYANLTGSSEPGPGWTDLFDETGKVKDLFGGQSATFIEDNISAGVATDMSMLISDDYVDNGTVQSYHDVGNVYVYRTTDTTGNRVLFVGVERLGAAVSYSYIDLEFTKTPFWVRQGSPWKVYGERANGDLLVRMNFNSGELVNLEFKQWVIDEISTDGTYQTIETAWPLDGQACNGSDGLYSFCDGTPVVGLPPSNPEVWNLNFESVEVPASDSFIEVGMNVGRLLGASFELSSLTIRTPEDIAFGASILAGGE